MCLILFQLMFILFQARFLIFIYLIFFVDNNNTGLAAYLRMNCLRREPFAIFMSLEDKHVVVNPKGQILQ